MDKEHTHIRRSAKFRNPYNEDQLKTVPRAGSLDRIKSTSLPLWLRRDAMGSLLQDWPYSLFNMTRIGRMMSTTNSSDRIFATSEILCIKSYSGVAYLNQGKDPQLAIICIPQ